MNRALSLARTRALGALSGAGRSAPLRVPPGCRTATPNFTRSFAYSIWEDVPQPEAMYAGTPKEVAEKVFLMHAVEGELLTPGQVFKDACHSLAREHPALSAIENVALEGRFFELIDESGDGLVGRDAWVSGVEQLLSPTTKRFANFKRRLDSGFVNEKEPTVAEGVKRVAIVGGGVAGLQTARALSKRGKECVIFEKSDNVGGVWRSNYADFGLQVPKRLYEFPEFPYPSGTDWELFPPGPQVQKYIEQYAEHFGVRDMTRLNTGVTSVASKGAEGGSGWKVTSCRKGGPEEEEEFDFVVVATGMYGWPPHIPYVFGQESFKGEIRHSQHFEDKDIAKGKKVVVIGGGKSAIDNAVAAGKVGESSTLVFRAAHWPVPRYLCNLVPFQWGTYSRFGHFMLTPHYETSNLAWYLHGLMAPVKWAWWRIVELMFRAQFRLPKEMLPDTEIEVDVFTGGQILNYEFRDMVKRGQAQAIKGSLEKFTENSIVLRDGTELPCDLAIFGTGFSKSYNIFDRLIQNKLDRSKDGLYLYRNMIPPRLPNIAFVGAEVSTFNNILTQGLQSEWLARVLSGEVRLPSKGEMMRSLEREQAWKRTWMPGTSARASILQLHMMKYHDRLVKDMGERHLRKGANVLAEVFSPYCAADYRPIFVE